MISLNNTTHKLQVVLTSATTTRELDIDVAYREDDASNIIPLGDPLTTNGTTAVDIVPAPAASKSRLIEYISVFNKDTVSAQVTIQKDISGTKFIIYKCTLGVGERLEFTDKGGFNSMTNSGALKTSLNQGNSPVGGTLNTVVLASDVTNNNAVANTIASVTGLSFPVTNGKKYWFRFVIQYTAAVSTTGSRWSISGPGGTMRYRSEYTSGANTQTLIEGLTAHDLPAASNGNSVVAGDHAVIEGFYEASSDGDVIARFASEVASSAIVAKAGSIVTYLEVL